MGTEGMNVLLPGVGKLVGTIKSFLGYIAELFYHYKDTTKIRAIIADSKDKYQDATNGKKGNYIQDGSKFYEWYKGVVEDMPIVSSYALANPLTGSYLGFLSLLSKQGKTVTDKQLQENLKYFDTLKDTARTFIQRHSVKLTCDRTTNDGRIVGLALDIVNGKEVNPFKLPTDWEAFIDEFNRYMQEEKARERKEEARKEEEVDSLVDDLNREIREEAKIKDNKDKRKARKKAEEVEKRAKKNDDFVNDFNRAMREEAKTEAKKKKKSLKKIARKNKRVAKMKASKKKKRQTKQVLNNKKAKKTDENSIDLDALSKSVLDAYDPKHKEAKKTAKENLDSLDSDSSDKQMKLMTDFGEMMERRKKKIQLNVN